MVSVEFGNEISVGLNAQAGAFAKRLEAAKIKGISEVALSYRSVAIFYDPMLLSYDKLVAICQPMAEAAIAQKVEQGAGGIVEQVVEVPVLYGGDDLDDRDACEDMEKICTHEKKTRDEIVKIHSETLARVYVLGFVPGYAYNSGDNGFTVPRLPSPRTSAPIGTVSICQNQTTVLPCSTPSGWHIIGRSPIKPTDLESDTPFLFSPGMWAKFVPIDKAQYAAIAAQVAAKTYVPNIYNKEDA